ncbi:uncharacterized protein [Temnothorax nylanderi]|uniref:uncharacterized protein n=1 Tax=Temnothorax nylanderi TaxID=102681 RepID=UPI003A845B28
MEIGRELGIESDQQGGKGKRKEGEGEKKARGRPTKAEELAKQRGRTNSIGSVREFLQKRKKEGVDEVADRAEKEILEKFNETRRVNRSPPTKIKKEEENKGNMAAEEMLKEILRKMEEQEKERKEDIEARKKDKEEIKNEIKGLREELKRSEEIWKKQKNALEERVKKMEDKIEKIGVRDTEENEGGEWLRKMKEIERNMEMAERRRRKNNIIVKEEKVGNDGERKERFEKLMEELNKTEGITEEIQELGYGDNKLRLLRCKSWESKRDIMKKKKELGRKYKSFLDDDLTKEERRIQTEIRKIAREKREKGKRVTIAYHKIWEDNIEWRWNESKGRLKERKEFRRA